MSRGLNNWSAADVIKFLRQNKFALSHTRGSHFYYIGKIGNRTRQVCVPVHGKNAAIHSKTLKGIILQSGISVDAWLTR